MWDCILKALATTTTMSWAHPTNRGFAQQRVQRTQRAGPFFDAQLAVSQAWEASSGRWMSMKTNQPGVLMLQSVIL